MIKNRYIICLLIIMCVSVSCNPVGGVKDLPLPGIAISEKDYNTVLLLEDDPAFNNSFLNGDLLTLLAKNTSDIPVLLPKDFGVKLFYKKDGAWRKVENIMGYGEGNYALYNDSTVIDVAPYLPEMIAPTTIRVVIVGKLENDPDHLVGAYRDVKLLPKVYDGKPDPTQTPLVTH